MINAQKINFTVKILTVKDLSVFDLMMIICGQKKLVDLHLMINVKQDATVLTVIFLEIQVEKF